MPAFNQLHHEQDVRTYKAGEMIIKEGDPGDYLFAVLEGQAVILRKGVELEVVEEGGIFGEMALIDSGPRNASVAAKTDCKVARIDQRRFLDLVQTMPYFAIQVMQALVNRIRLTTK